MSDPISDLRAIADALERRKVPPEEVADRMAAGIREYLSGDKSLDKYLGLNSGVSGVNSPRSRAQAEAQMLKLFGQMYNLVGTGICGVDHAAYMVSERLDADIKAGRSNGPKKTQATLANYWSQKPNVFRYVFLLRSPLADAILKDYPEHCWPPEFKK